jgi:hypothetical protein
VLVLHAVAMQQYGNATNYNIENVLVQNIINSDYFRRQCVDLKTWEEVVDEIYDSVTDVEPWMSGNARGPSSAFCLVYRMAQIKPTEAQVQETITCADSPYIRAVSVARGLGLSNHPLFVLAQCMGPVPSSGLVTDRALHPAGWLPVPEVCLRPQELVGLVQEVHQRQGGEQPQKAVSSRPHNINPPLTRVPMHRCLIMPERCSIPIAPHPAVACAVPALMRLLSCSNHQPSAQQLLHNAELLCLRTCRSFRPAAAPRQSPWATLCATSFWSRSVASWLEQARSWQH